MLATRLEKKVDMKEGLCGGFVSLMGETTFWRGDRTAVTSRPKVAACNFATSSLAGRFCCFFEGEDDVFLVLALDCPSTAEACEEIFPRAFASLSRDGTPFLLRRGDEAVETATADGILLSSFVGFFYLFVLGVFVVLFVLVLLLRLL